MHMNAFRIRATVRAVAICTLAMALLSPATAFAQASATAKDKAANSKPDAKTNRQTNRQTNRLFLWKVTGKTGTAAYLLGSIHVATPEFYPLPKEMDAAFKESDVLAVEVDITKVDQAAVQKLMLQKGMYPLGDSLAKHVSKETLKKFRDYCAAKGLPAAAMEQFRPWALAVTVTMLEMQAIGYSAEMGIDKHFLDKAGDKKVVELETAESQLDLLSGFAEKAEAGFLESTLDSTKETLEMIRKLSEAWKAGEVKGLEELTLTTPLKEHPELKPVFAKLFDERNAKMAQKVEGFLKGKQTHFVIVGAGHLIGDKGIVKLLEKKGYKVEQVQGSGETAEEKSPEEEAEKPAAKTSEERRSRLFRQEK
jgi:uncharacterized protein YbaP (TraB family)